MVHNVYGRPFAQHTSKEASDMGGQVDGGYPRAAYPNDQGQAACEGHDQAPCNSLHAKCGNDAQYDKVNNIVYGHSKPPDDFVIHSTFALALLATRPMG
jgi:hypothetical protein